METTIAWLSAETPGIDGGGGRRRQFHQVRVLLERGIGVHAATLEALGVTREKNDLILGKSERMKAKKRLTE